jgi:DNA-binding transcriptional regulator YiaG
LFENVHIKSVKQLKNIEILYTDSLMRFRSKLTTDSEQLERIMERMHMTQSQFAKEIGVPTATLSHIFIWQKHSE